jgi:phosphatidylinositol glycan class F
MLKLKNSNNILLNVSLTFGELIISILIIYLIAVTFGASLIEDFKETLFFSFFMTILCVAPIVLFVEHANMFSLFERLFLKNEFNNNLEQKCFQVSVNAIKGAWLGCLVIPLDWDRWWQSFPICCCIGALIGTFYGLLICRN